MKKVLAVALLLFPAVASAQQQFTIDSWGYNKLDGRVNLGTRALEDTIGGVINVILGFLGILTTLIILWGGFKWMTSQGNTDQVQDAKKIIGAGVAGLVIVLVSYAIARYVVAQLYYQTTGNQQ